jgi:glycosyltransferase involved in cell wall biosynthesis
VKIALNLVFLVPGEVGGMETYARELIPRLAEAEGVEVVCLVNREAALERGAPWGQGCPMRVVPVHARNRIEWVRGEQQHVPRMARAAGCDLIHSLASTAPLWGPVPRVTTIHDLNYRTVPDAHFGLRGLGMRVLVPGAARRSRRLIVDAASTARDLTTHLRVARGKIDVVPLAASPPAPGVVPTGEAALRARLGLGSRPVAFCPGAKRPHKNLTTVIAAVARMPADTRPVVVASGYSTPYESELRSAAGRLGVADALVMPPWLDAADLEGLYALAGVVVVASRYEGFGLPVVEAMIRGVPVIASDVSSLPEVAGDAALLVAPDDVDGFASAITDVLGDPSVARRLALAGRERAAGFSWERTAAETVASYRLALGRRAPLA